MGLACVNTHALRLAGLPNPLPSGTLRASPGADMGPHPMAFSGPCVTRAAVPAQRERK